MWPTSTLRSGIRRFGVVTLALFTAFAFLVIVGAEPALAQGDPTFSVRMADQEIHGYHWVQAVDVVVEVDDPDTTALNPDWSDTQRALPPEWDPTMGFVQFQPFIDDFVLEAGFVVTMTQLGVTKTHTVTSLAVTGVDEVDDVVSGTGDNGIDVRVDAWDEMGVGMSRDVAVAGGAWIADFGEGADTFDIAPGTSGEAAQWDGDGDSTQWSWRVPNPAFSVETPREIWSLNDGWIAGRTVTLTVDADDDPSNGFLYQTATTVVSWGPGPWEAGWSFNNLPFTIEAGRYVIADDGVEVTKVLHVVDLAVTDVDPVTDDVTGTAPAGASVDVHACEEFTCHNLTVQPDAGGVWVADFTGFIEIDAGFGGAAQIWDADGDSTHRGWHLQDPYFGVDVANEEMWAANWPAGETLTFQVFADDTMGDLLWTDTMEVFGTPWQNTEAGYRFWGDFDVAGGQYITVSDGILTKELVVSTVSISEVNPDDDFYAGTVDPAVAADAGREVCAWARMLGDLNQGVELCDVPDPTSGEWMIDFAAIGDIIPGDHLGVYQRDEDGDETYHSWGVPPWIYIELAEQDEAGVDLYPDRVGLEQWIGPVDIFINDVEVMSDVVTSGEYIQVDLDVAIGQTVRVVDGHDDKSLLIEELTVDNVTPWDDVVQPSTAFGTAAVPDNTRQVQVTASADYGWWTERWVPVIAERYEADFANPGNGWRESEIGYFGEGGADDVYVGGEVRANLWDFDNDQVQAIWHSCNPRIIIVRNNDRIEAVCFPVGSELVIELDDPRFDGIEWTSGTPVVVTRNPDKPWESLVVFQLGNYTAPDNAVVTATATPTQGNPVVVTTEVIPFTVDFIDEENDTITGTAPEGSEVLVQADGNWRYPVADATNTWVADFSEPGDRPGEENPVNLQPGSEGGATLIDDAGSATTIAWRISNATFNVEPANNHLWGHDWLPDSTVTITINGDFHSTVPTTGNGDIEEFDPGTTDIASGMLIEVTDGDAARSHRVTPLAITSVDPDTDIITGTGTDFGTIDIWIHGTDISRSVDVDGLGGWTTDFTGTHDLVPGDNGNSNECDDGGNCTFAGWWIPQAQFQVSPVEGSIWANGFEPGGEITITIGDSDLGPYPTDEWGNFDGNNYGLTFEVPAGSEVSIFDGTTTKAHTVTELAITSVDPDTEKVFGVAALGSSVDVWVHDSDAWRRVVADTDVGEGLGSWEADFTAAGIDEPDEQGTANLVSGSNGNSGQCDDDSDCTNAGWRVFNPTFTVETPFSVWSSNEDWKLGDTITLTIDDPSFVPMTTDVVLIDGEPDYIGWSFDLEGVFPILHGSVVTVTDGDSTKSLEVFDLSIDAISSADDTVTGWLLDETGQPLLVGDVPVEVDVDNENGHSHRTAITGPDGYWVADFAVPGDGDGEQSQPFDIQPNTGVSAQVFDEDWDSIHRGDCFECDDGGYHIDPISIEHGDVLISETDGTLWLYRPDTAELFEYQLPFGGVWDIQWLYHDTILIANTGGGLLWVLHLPSGDLEPIEDELFASPIGVSIASSAVGWSPNAAWLADTGILRFDDSGATQVVDTVGTDGIVVAPDGSVYFTDLSGALYVVDETQPDNYRLVAQVDGYGLNGLIMTPDGKVLATSMGSPALVTIDPSDGSYTVEDYPQLRSPEDSAIGQSGEIYVIDSGYVDNFGDDSGLYVRNDDGTLTQLVSHHDYLDFGDTVDLLVAGPWVTVTKEAGHTEVFAPGETVTFDVNVYNQIGPFGSVSLDSLNDSVSGDLIALEGCLAPELASGESSMCSYEIFVAGDVTNTVTAGWTDNWGGSGESEASASVHVVSPAISIDKTTADGFGNEGDGIGVLGGETVMWTYLVNNEGDVDLFELMVTDDQIGEVCVIDRIAVGDSETCTAEGVAGAGEYVNVGTVTGVAVDADGDAEAVEAEDGSSYFGLEPGYVTDGSLCSFGEEFDLIFTPDMMNWPGHYKLAASNPGQFSFNAFFADDGSTGTFGLEIPYPFVTQGAMPLHAYSGVFVDGGPCFAPVGELAAYPTTFGLSDYTDTNDDGVVGFGDVYVVDVPADALFQYVTLHLDHGLKGTKGWIGGAGDAFNDPALTPELAGIDVVNGTEHWFAVLADHVPLDGGTDVAFNVNAFKNVKGFGGTVLGEDTLAPAAATVELHDADGTLIETMTTDEHGWYLSDYRHKGKKADYLLVMVDDGGATIDSRLVTVGKAVKFGEANFFLPS